MEQEKLKNVLQNIVQEAENYNIVSIEELLKMLENELSQGLFVTIND